MIETDPWPFIPARYFKHIDTPRKVRVLVLHSMESPETNQTAENVAHYFQTTDRPASSHVCVDADSVVQCVKDNDVAYAAPGCNADGIQIEMAGRAAQTLADWSDPYSTAMLDRAAEVVAQYAAKYSIPIRHLSNEDLRAGHAGIVGHYQVSAVYKKSSHSDPGSGFPWSSFIERVLSHYRLRSAKL